MTQLSQEIINGAQAASMRWGVPACAGLAQCILESQGFKYEPVGSNNGLGIQALMGLPSVAATSFEYVAGRREPVVEHFAKFNSIGEAFDEWGKLLATNPVYADAFKVRTDWRQFIRLMSPHYATAPNYGNILIGLVETNRLDQYNVLSKGVSMTTGKPAPLGALNIPNAAPAAAPSPAAAAASKAVSYAPAIGGTVQVDVGDFAEQLIAYCKQLVEEGVAAGEPIVLAQIPLGSLIGSIITPQVIDGYIDQAAAVVDKAVAGANVSANSIVVGLFKSGQPLLSEFLQNDVEPLFAKALSKIKSL